MVALQKGRLTHLFLLLAILSICCSLSDDSFPFWFLNVNAEDKNCLIGGGSSSRNA